VNWVRLRGEARGWWGFASSRRRRQSRIRQTREPKAGRCSLSLTSFSSLLRVNSGTGSHRNSD